MKILHIHQDFPDQRNYPFTLAVSNLLDASSEISRDAEHLVLSINRTSNPFKVSLLPFERGLSFVYFALPITLIYLPVIWLYSKALSRRLKKEKISIIHAHTATTEALFARYLSKTLNVPFVVTARGGSDLHNINRLPFEKNSFRKNFLQAKHAFWVCKWFQPQAEKMLNLSLNSKSSGLPNICNIDSVRFDKSKLRQDKYFTVISFHQYKRKGIIQLIRAIAELRRENISINLDIYGTGPRECVEAVKNCINENGLDCIITLKGQINNIKLLKEMESYKGLLLPSAKETLGMAYIEALATGNIIMYHKNTGFDGFFEDTPVGYAVENQDIDEIKTGLKELEAKYATFFDNVVKLQTNQSLKIFTAEYVAQHYINTIKKVSK